MSSYLDSILRPFYDTRVVRDGRQALQQCLKHPPGLILSDVMMPNMDGFELIASIRSNHDLKLIPIILLSARAGDEARVEGLENGADDYMGKPFSPKELVARVRTHLELGRLRRELIQLARLSPVGIIRMDTEVCFHLRADFFPMKMGS